MKNLLITLVASLCLAVSLSSQCFGTMPNGTVDLGGACSDIPGSTSGPFVNPAGPVSASIGLFRLYWSNIPGADPAPIAVAALDFGISAPMPLGSCSVLIQPHLLLVTCSIDATQPGCQTGAVISFPPNPGLAGLQFYGQGAMIDQVLGGVAVSNVFLTTLQ